MNNLNYGMIGNCRSAALISNTGTIEWLCLPRFDSASVFAALLDKENGGHMAVIPRKPLKIKQQYILRTNILSTRFECEDGKWRNGDGEWRMENGEWRMENGKWRMENGEWKMKNGK